VTGRPGRPRTFPLGAVELALVERDRASRTWVEIARELGVRPGTLRARIADHRRGNAAHKTHREAEIVLETGRESSPPARCGSCRLIHSPEAACP
jgi:hypothetical protein